MILLYVEKRKHHQRLNVRRTKQSIFLFKNNLMIYSPKKGSKNNMIIVVLLYSIILIYPKVLKNILELKYNNTFLN